MLPFIAGIAVGAVAVVAYNKNDKIKSAVGQGLEKAKDMATEASEKTKEIACDVKATVSEKVESLKSKKETEDEMVSNEGEKS